MRFKVFGTEIYISFLFAALIALMLATDRTGMALPAIFAVFMHEMGHLFCMWVTDCAPKAVRLIPASIQIRTSIGVSYKRDIAVAICGPAVNFILFGILYFNYAAYSNKTVLYYSLLNLIIGLFNMLPVKGLDGGTILYSLLAKRMEISRVCIIMRIVTLALALIILSIAIIMSVKGKLNLSVYIISIYLFVTAIMKM